MGTGAILCTMLCVIYYGYIKYLYDWSGNFSFSSSSHVISFGVASANARAGGHPA